MFDRLHAIANRYEEVTNRLYQPEVTTQPALYRALMKEATNCALLLKRIPVISNSKRV